MLLETYLSNLKNVMHKPRKSLRVREITAWHSAGFSLHAGPHVRLRQCEHSLYSYVNILCRPGVRVRGAGPAVQACTPARASVNAP